MRLKCVDGQVRPSPPSAVELMSARGLLAPVMASEAALRGARREPVRLVVSDSHRVGVFLKMHLWAVAFIFIHSFVSNLVSSYKSSRAGTHTRAHSRMHAHILAHTYAYTQLSSSASSPLLALHCRSVLWSVGLLLRTGGPIQPQRESLVSRGTGLSWDRFHRRCAVLSVHALHESANRGTCRACAPEGQNRS